MHFWWIGASFLFLTGLAQQRTKSVSYPEEETQPQLPYGPDAEIRPPSVQPPIIRPPIQPPVSPTVRPPVPPVAPPVSSVSPAVRPPVPPVVPPVSIGSPVSPSVRPPIPPISPPVPIDTDYDISEVFVPDSMQSISPSVSPVSPPSVRPSLPPVSSTVPVESDYEAPEVFIPDYVDNLPAFSSSGPPIGVSPFLPSTIPTNVLSPDIYEVMPAGEMAQILSIGVDCSMTSMRITVNFDRIFDGVIYSKGFFSNPTCHYVPWGSRQSQYEFEITMDKCGTQFIDNMASGGTASLENILLIQNEPTIQEMWDLARRVQCTWDGQVEQTISSGIQVDMLDTIAVAYNGDDISAEMDIRVGKGPFGPRAQGLVKIGEPLTAVVNVFGSGDMDVTIHDCIAHDGDRNNGLQLSDSNGCIVKKKLMGAWQLTRQTGATGASLIAYANLQGFRFPDKTDVYLECGIEICKGQCPNYCPEYPPIDFRTEARSKRNVDHAELRDATLVRAFRVIDQPVGSNKSSVLIEEKYSAGEMCFSTLAFTFGLITLIILLVFTSLTAVFAYFRLKTLRKSICIRANNKMIL